MKFNSNVIRYLHYNLDKLNGASGTIAIELDQMVESYKKTLAGV